MDLGSVSGFQTEPGAPGDGCFLRFRLAVGAEAPLGLLEMPLLNEAEKKSLPPVTVLVVAREQGPIPPGLNPRVD